CVSCHNGGSTEPDLRSWDLAMKGTSTGSVIVPYTADWSHLFGHLNSYSDLGPIVTPTMPPDSNQRLTRNQVQTIKNWLLDGAKSKSGKLFWQSTYQSSNNKYFVLCSGSDLIAVIDPQSYRVMHYIPVGVSESIIEAPHYITLSPDKQFLYVTLIGGSAVEKYRTDNYQKVGRVTVASDPAHIEIRQDGKRGVVSHYTTTIATKFTYIDTENMTVLDVLNDATGDVSDKPHGIAVKPDFSAIYFTASNGTYITKVTISNDRFDSFERYSILANGQLTSSSLYEPYQIVLYNSKLYVTCKKSSELRILNEADGRLLKVFTRTPGSPSIGKNPILMIPYNQRLYVTCLSEENFPEQGSKLGCISVFDLTTDSFIQNIWNVGHMPRSVSVYPAKNLLFVSNENQNGIDPPHHYIPSLGTSQPGKFNVVDLTTMRVIPSAERDVAIAPYGTAILP
ncbi:MAG: beta-propeller fold lactonase family protein, partial [Bacteroidia bacterium]|nr:beta-propeller fold lactonase family protein [Bacteroidia bacterium]